PAVRGERLADRLRPGGERVQVGGGRPAQAERHAMERSRLRRDVPPPRALPQPTGPVGAFLENLPKLTTIVMLTQVGYWPGARADRIGYSEYSLCAEKGEKSAPYGNNRSRGDSLFPLRAWHDLDL